jgi:hypothetical protein
MANDLPFQSSKFVEVEILRPVACNRFHRFDFAILFLFQWGREGPQLTVRQENLTERTTTGLRYADYAVHRDFKGIPHNGGESVIGNELVRVKVYR